MVAPGDIDRFTMCRTALPPAASVTVVRRDYHLAGTDEHRPNPVQQRPEEAGKCRCHRQLLCIELRMVGKGHGVTDYDFSFQDVNNVY
jgi:hypothetical protein